MVISRFLQRVCSVVCYVEQLVEHPLLNSQLYGLQSCVFVENIQKFPGYMILTGDTKTHNQETVSDLLALVCFRPSMSIFALNEAQSFP